MRVIIIGAGGHGQVVADALLAHRNVGVHDLALIGFADDDERLWGQEIMAMQVLGPIAAALATPHDALVVAIGDNHTRCQMMRRLAAQGESFIAVVHPSAVISPGVQLGPGAVVFAGAVVNTGACLGSGVIVNTCASLDHHSRVGDYAHIAPGAHTGGHVAIGEGAFVGLGASIIPQRAIGAWATVGAGATVIHDVPAHVTVVGTPARIIKQSEELR